jgi:hypothetical protein
MDLSYYFYANWRHHFRVLTLVRQITIAETLSNGGKTAGVYTVPHCE